MYIIALKRSLYSAKLIFQVPYYLILIPTTLLIQDPALVGCCGNLLLDRAVGAKLLLVPPKEDRGVVDYDSLYEMIEQYAGRLT